MPSRQFTAAQARDQACLCSYPKQCIISLVPRPSASSAHLTFELARNQKSGGESGEFYHVSDVKGREKVERT